MNPLVAATSANGQALDDPARLFVLSHSGLMDSPPEETYDRFTRLASKILRCPVSLVSLVDDNRQFFKSQIGLPGVFARKRETPLSHSFCQHVVRGGESLIIPDARNDARVAQNLAIPELGVIAYLGVPVRTDDGFILGSFCAIDGQPRDWTKEEVGLLEDLGRALASEIRLGERTRILLASIEHKEEAERGRDQMLHMLVHDMRTPAGIVLSTLEMIEPDPGDPDQCELHSLAKKSASDLLGMISDMLEVHRMEEGKPVLDKNIERVAEVLREAFVQTLPAMELKGQKFNVHYPEGEPLLIALDRRLIVRVLVNLLTNAHKYSPAGAEIELRAERDEGGVFFRVEDNGPGLSDEDKAGLFERFGQGLGGASRPGDSFGLGLAFCRLAIEAHGGAIWAEDREGGGVSFFARLPS